MLDRYTKVPDQPHHLLLMGGEPGEHQLRGDVQPSRHHAVEEGTLHHLRRGNSQHTGARCRGQVCARGGSAQIMMSVGVLKLMKGWTGRALKKNNLFTCGVVVFCLIWGDSHVGRRLWPLQLHSQEQYWHAIPGVHSGPGWWVCFFTTDNHVCGLISISRMCGVRVPTPFDSGLAQ